MKFCSRKHSMETMTFITVIISITFLTFSEGNHISLNIPLAKRELANKRPTFEDYKGQRKNFILSEEHRFLGANLTLTADEQTVNKYIMRSKQEELAKGFNDSYNFIPARHYFEMLDRFGKSKLFRVIRRLPKGGVLHAHSTALGNVQLMVNVTYRDNLWQMGGFEKIPGPKFKFSKKKPGDGWSLVSEVRKSMTDNVYDAKIAELYSLYNADPLNAYKSLDKVWSKFESLFTCLKPIITYEPVLRQYYRNSLQLFYDDNVQYLEFRASLSAVYDLEGKIYSREEIVQMFYDDTELFKRTHPKFIGVKLIYAPARYMNDEGLQKVLQTTRQLHSKFPSFLAGFDLVGQEDPGRALFEFAPALLALPKSINFFFHAGETNWFGMKSDENLIDAVLLGTKRIGHGFAALKHPNILKEIKRRNICIEINPISNQILKLVQDLRNHPAALLFSDNYPVVVSSDDPAFWQATPLSHDFYLAFIGIASARQDLRLLKKLALNSIEYSAMNRKEKLEALKMWKRTWHEAMKVLALDIVAGKLQ